MAEAGSGRFRTPWLASAEIRVPYLPLIAVSGSIVGHFGAVTQTTPRRHGGPARRARTGPQRHGPVEHHLPRQSPRPTRDRRPADPRRDPRRVRSEEHT